MERLVIPRPVTWGSSSCESASRLRPPRSLVSEEGLWIDLSMESLDGKILYLRMSMLVTSWFLAREKCFALLYSRTSN